MYERKEIGEIEANNIVRSSDDWEWIFEVMSKFQVYWNRDTGELMWIGKEISVYNKKIFPDTHRFSDV